MEKEVEINKLRPLHFSDFTGQDTVKEELKMAIESAKSRSDVIEHVLLLGPPGLGKTTLAGIVANEMGSNFVPTSGVVLQSVKDIIDVLLNLKYRDVLFIDEIHRLPGKLQEILYPAMEDYRLDIVLGDNIGARQVSLGKFTLIAATTRNGMISTPMHDRFGIICSLDLYSVDELVKIIKRSSSLLDKIKVDADGSDAIIEIAKRARGTPRIANSLLRRVRDYAVVRNNGIINKDIISRTLKLLDIDEQGLGKMDIKILKTLAIFKKPVGLKILSSISGEDIKTILEVYEPYLLRMEFIRIERNGRLITEKGLEHLKMKK